MSWSLILRRMARSRRDMIMLLAALSLVTGFFALGPLYLRALGESGLKYAVENARPRELTLTLRSDKPFDMADRPRIGEALGAVSNGVEALTVMEGVLCNNFQNNLCFGDENFRAYVPVAYERLTERFALSEGRFPTAENEIAITRVIADIQGLMLNTPILIYPDSPDELTLIIVGIVEPITPDDRFWLNQNLPLYGQLIDVTENFQRFDMGVIVTEAVYESQIRSIAPGNTRYDWYVETNTDALRAASLDQLATSFDNLERYFRSADPEFVIAGGLYTLVTEYQTDLRAVEGTVILCAVGVLVLLFYQLMMTTALILERQSLEWSAISSRGGSTAQLIRMQAGTMTILALMAFVIGLPVAFVILVLVGIFSPLSAVIGGGTTLTTLPPLSVILCAAAALGAVVTLTIPAIPAARTSLLRLKQSISRPPLAPVWTRYFVDFTLIALGVFLLLRLYFLFGGTSLEEFFRDPSALLRVITANTAQDTGLLNDPFNLAAAAVLITGLILFWLRLFPLFMRVLGALISRSNGLAAPLALWNIARDPGHYAQLVMVMIGTLSIGTTSLVLAATHDAGAWNTARFATGNDAAVTFELEAPLGMEHSPELLLRTQTVEPREIAVTQIFGISAERFAALGGTINDVPTPTAGFALPAEARAITVQVYVEPHPDGAINTRIAVEVVNQLGVPRTIRMTTTDDTITGEFIPYTAELPDDPHLPFTFVAFRFQSRAAGSEFTGVTDQVIFLDDPAYIAADGRAVTMDDFERSAITDWSWGANRFGVPGTNRGLFASASRSQQVSGQYSMRAQVTVAQVGAQFDEPLLQAHPITVEQYIPIIVSPETAIVLTDRELTPGSRGELTLNMREGARTLRYEVAAIVPAFSSAGDRFLIAPADALIPFLNAAAAPQRYYGLNTAWLTLPDRLLDSDTRSRIEALPGVVDTAEAWTTYNLLVRQPLPNAVVGVLYAGFWVSLALALLDFGFYLAMTVSRRATSFAVLRAFGWQRAQVWGLLIFEQAALVVPALVIGLGLGVMLAYLLAPFLALFGDETLRFPMAQIGVLYVVLVIGFAALLAGTAVIISRVGVGQALRSGEE